MQGPGRGVWNWQEASADVRFAPPRLLFLDRRASWGDIGTRTRDRITWQLPGSVESARNQRRDGPRRPWNRGRGSFRAWYNHRTRCAMQRKRTGPEIGANPLQEKAFDRTRACAITTRAFRATILITHAQLVINCYITIKDCSSSIPRRSSSRQGTWLLLKPINGMNILRPGWCEVKAERRGGKQKGERCWEWLQSFGLVSDWFSLPGYKFHSILLGINK